MRARLHGAGRQGRRVVVPLEQLHRRRERAEQRVGGAGLGDLDVVPADLGLGHAVRRCSGCLGQQLTTETDAENRNTAIEGIAEERLSGDSHGCPSF